MRLGALVQRCLFAMSLHAVVRDTSSIFPVDQVAQVVAALFQDFQVLNDYVEPTLPVTVPRLPGAAPAKAENKLNAWAWKCDIHDTTAPKGLLSGKTIALKDNVQLAGIPCTNGSKLLQGFIPNEDATVVSRILSHGGRITGKATNEGLCLSGGSWTSWSGPVLNSIDNTRQAGGSSSGSAVLVATGEVDMAIGGDQGGSIRIPACWNGVVGLKPTIGFVPYTGIFAIEPTVDHAGPIAKNVLDTALLLEAIAGRDVDDNGYLLDARQASCFLKPRREGANAEHESVAGLGRVPSFSKVCAETVGSTVESATAYLSMINIGVITEGFATAASEEDVDSTVRAALKRVPAATVTDVSIPIHSDGMKVWMTVGFEGVMATQYCAGGQGTGVRGHFSTSMMEYSGRSYCSDQVNNSLSISNKLFLIGGNILRGEGSESGGNHGDATLSSTLYGRAQNLFRTIKRDYDAALDKYDVLVLPTLPKKPTKLPTERNVGANIGDSFNMTCNTGPFDASGHPAITIPIGYSEGLPIGLMIVGKWYAEQKVLNVARAIELVIGELTK
eukprot:TRINITY_DN5798_c0_g2_i2.p1 TRINITY_DN5798_c0_g2~~TRINITY_DN5798_c0_g2_i2.p1  ORF type:complete len:558 (-),score=97.00 TRINITY_DN5798_c0_g2_i2:83-1756(-)